VKVKHISGNWKRADVSMKLRWYNRNIVETHFGESLYSMTDPYLMLMLRQILGKEYRIWDQPASIKFVRSGKGTITAIFEISETDLSTIVENTADGKNIITSFGLMLMVKMVILWLKSEKCYIFVKNK
jgi:hypothetical protein